MRAINAALIGLWLLTGINALTAHFHIGEQEMAMRWSHVANDVVEVDERSSIRCFECAGKFWIDEVRWDSHDPFCSECYYNIFGGN